MGDTRISGASPNFAVEFKQKYAETLEWAQTKINGGDFDPNVSGDFARSTGMQAPRPIDMGQLIAMVQSLRQKTEEQNLDVNTNRVETVKQRQADEADERLEKMEEQKKSMGEAEKAGVFQKVFGYIASALMILAGAILCATGVGSAAGIAMIAGGATMLTMQVLQEDAGTGKSAMTEMVGALAEVMAGPGASEEEKEKAKAAATGVICGILTAVAVVAGTIAGGPFLGMSMATQTMGPLFTPENLEAMGMNEEDAPWASLGINIALAIVGIAAGAGSAKAVSKAGEMSATGAKLLGGIAGKAANTAAKAAESGVEVAKATSRAVEIGGKIAGYGAAAASATAMVGSGSATIVGSVANRDAAEAQADLAEIAAEQMLMQKQMEELQDKLKEIIQRLQEGASIVMETFNDVGDVNKNIARIGA